MLNSFVTLPFHLHSAFFFFACQLLTYSIKFSEVPKGHIKKRTEVSEVGLTLQIPTMKSVILKSPAQPLQACYDSNVKFSRH